uniref:Uncharacterized protein n=1 Tax=Strix occidentalis caurina TaxID=311401 RepID=A0A8D0KQ23_STROC
PIRPGVGAPPPRRARVPSRTGTTRLPVSSLSRTRRGTGLPPNPLFSPRHPHGLIKAQPYQKPRGVTPNPKKHRCAQRRPKRQMLASPPRNKTPALGRGLMEGARSSIPATSCRGKRLGCLRHQHPAPTIYGAWSPPKRRRARCPSSSPGKCHPRGEAGEQPGFCCAPTSQP